jgi:type IV pilus assembly protein PilA
VPPRVVVGPLREGLKPAALPVDRQHGVPSVTSTPHHEIDVSLRRESGFTLIELLVVILIIGILAAIAIPSFLNQKGKANDAGAKELARTAQTAMESWATDHNGAYAGVSSPADLQSIEPTINTNANGQDAYLSQATGSSSGYTVVVAAGTTGDQFSIVKNASTVDHTCSGSGSDCVGGTW